MKKFIFVCMLILTMSTTVFASDVDLQINGERINFTDSNGATVNPGIINSRMMVPMRKIFEVLGAEVNWNGETRTVTGTKGNIEIKLQIDNKIATKTINGVTEEIVLDTPPMLMNSRTMVPLRFVAESLDKQVGWDADNRTAIIIDYDYFANRMNEKLPALYSFMKNDINNFDGTYTHKYIDMENTNKNNEFKLSLNVKNDNQFRNANMTISGTSDLSKEIISEGWNDVDFKMEYLNDGINFDSADAKIKEMFLLNQDGLYKSYDELGLEGNENISLENMFQTWAGVPEVQMNINTFSLLKKDFDNLCNLFTKSGNTTYKATINYSNYNVKYFDLAKFDNFIFDSEGTLAYNFVNELFFKRDLLKDEMLYDNSEIKITVDVLNNAKEIKVLVEGITEYNEKNEYIVNFKSI